MSDKYDEQAAALRDDINAAIDTKIAAALRELGTENKRLQEAVQYWVALWEKAGTAAIRLQGENAERLAERDDLRQQLAAAERERDEAHEFMTAAIAENERLARDLARIGDHAVVDFDDATVRLVDEALVDQPKTYIEVLRAEHREWKETREQLTQQRIHAERLAASLTECDDKVDRLIQQLAAAERERDEARAMLHEVALSPSPICSQIHGKYCDCVGDKVTKWLAAQADKARGGK